MIFMSESPCVVTILAPSNESLVYIRLVGAVENGSESALGEAVDRVRELKPRTVLINCAGVTFAGVVLIHFLARVRAAAPDALIWLSHARPMVRFLISVSDLDNIVTLDDHGS